jgi:putative oxidoreductase
MGWASSFFMLIGRLLIATLLLLSVYNKVTNYDGTVAYMASKGLPMIPLLLGLSIVIEFIGGLSLVFGYKVRIISIIVILYLIPVSLIMHDFWMINDPMQKQNQMYHFFKNLAIIGGLLYIAATGPGYFGFHKHRHRKEEEIQKYRKEEEIKR